LADALYVMLEPETPLTLNRVLVTLLLSIELDTEHLPSEPVTQLPPPPVVQEPATLAPATGLPDVSWTVAVT
jgi:hypothetical protein